jgi:hypothetical protein
VNIRATRALSLDVVASSAGASAPALAARRERVSTDTAATLSRRDATQRSVATVCLAGIALVQAIELPFVFARGSQFGVLSIATMALCMGLGMALTAAPADTAEGLWRLVSAGALVVLAGWAVPHVFAVPGMATATVHGEAAARADWTAMPGGICAALAAVCLAVATVAAPPTRASVRRLATTVAVVLAMTPAVATLLVAFGPGLTGGETSLAAGITANVHANHGLNESQITFQPIAGSSGGHYVYRAPAPPHQTAIGLGLIAAATFVFVYGAIGYLRRRSAVAPVVAPGLEGSPA